MELKLIANYLVPDDEVWVSPATWENPFSLKAKESTVTDTQQLHPEIAPTIMRCFQQMGYGDAKDGAALAARVVAQLSGV